MTQEQAGLPVRLKIGETGNDVQILADKDGEQIDLCDILPIARLTLNVEGPHAYTAVAVELELEAVEADVERAQLRFSESDLRWIAKAHGYALVPIGEVKPAGVRCGKCKAAYSLGVSVDEHGWVELGEAPDAHPISTGRIDLSCLWLGSIGDPIAVVGDGKLLKPEGDGQWIVTEIEHDYAAGTSTLSVTWSPDPARSGTPT